MKSPRGADPTPVRHELLLAGGGHAHVAVIRHFAMHPVPGLRLTVVSRDVLTPYSGMLPGLVAGHYTIADSHIDLRALCQASGARLVHASVLGIDRARRLVHVEGRAPLAYDWLSLNTGSRPALDRIEGAARHGAAVKPIDGFLARWEGLLRELHQKPRALRIVVVGAGAAGVEVLLACDHALRKALGPNGPRCPLVLVDAAPRLLPTHNARVGRHFARVLAERAVELRLGTAVTAADAAGLHLADGSRIDADFVVWAIQAGAPAWPRESGLACDEAGFVRVEPTLRVCGEERIFAAGDLAALPQAVARSGVYAVRGGEHLAPNLARAVRGEPLRAWTPQRRFLSLLTSGGRYAVASRGRLFAHGEWVWRWKDRIDRRFMAMYRVPPATPPAPGEEPAMRCGGCAAKVGADTLHAALATLQSRAHDDVLVGLEGADDAAVIAPPAGQQLVQSVDYFRAFIDDPWLVGRIAAVHALGDLHAMGARPHSALAIATVPHAAPAIVRDCLQQLMQGALATLDEEGVALIGGHSSEGSELGFGLSVNGFVAEDELLRKTGLRAGDALLLLKPLGTGVLLAANAAAAAEGRWIEEALACMQQSNRAAVAVLRAHGVRACTDVTGFGLLGHLGEMLRGAACGARLSGMQIPALAGARECLARGWRSSLHASNAQALQRLESPVDDVAGALLVDPQTAGGLLAAVPAEQAAACLVALRAAGYARACHIGSCETAVSAGRVRLD